MKSYTHLKKGEQTQIKNLKKKGDGVRQIARRIGRDPSTVSRHLRKGKKKKKK